MSRFVVLSPGFPESESDTTCLPAFQKFVLAIQAQYPSLNICVVAFQYPFHKKVYHWHGIQVICMGGANKPGISRLLIWLRVFGELWRCHKKEKIIGITSLWLTECALVGKYFGKHFGIKHYMWLIGQDAKKTNQYISRIKPEAQEIIAMSDFLQESYFENHGVKPFMVAENGLWLKEYPPTTKQSRSYDIIGVGSLIALKNYALFIDIVHALTKKFPHIKVAIAGVGELADTLQAEVKQRQLSNNLIFLGLLDHAAVINLMQDARIFLHTSDYEGNSTVLMEALYCGCEVYSTQGLAHRHTDHLHVLQKKADFISAIDSKLEDPNQKYTPVLFNDMRNTAKKILSLYSLE